MASPVVNITGYKFVDLPDRDALRQVFRDECAKLGLKGLILLSFEGAGPGNWRDRRQVMDTVFRL